MELLQLDHVRMYRAKVRGRDGQVAFVPVAVVVDAKTGKKSVSSLELPAQPVGVRFARAVVDAVNAAEGKPPVEEFEDIDLDFGGDMVVNPDVPAPTHEPPAVPPTARVPRGS